MDEEKRNFPGGAEFLEVTRRLTDECGKRTDEFCAGAGKKLPQTMKALGTTLSILYRLGCCHYGCRGGDHQVEWLIVKFVNQALSAYRLTRDGQYDEALTLIRGAGEIVNLFWLFHDDPNALGEWRASDKKTRMNKFGPGAVRGRLKNLPIGPPIDDDRYSALCEIGTHPTPMQIPGHYSGTGRGVLGAIVQEVGVFVCVNELSYATAMTVPVGILIGAAPDVREQLKAASLELLDTIGSVTVLNYEEGLASVRKMAMSRALTQEGKS